MCDTTTTSRGSDATRQATTVTVSTPHPFLGHEMRVELSDGRVLIGTLAAYQGSGDLLLSGVLERCTFKDGATVVHALNVVAVPFRHVRRLHRRMPDSAPITLAAPDMVA